MLFYYLWIPALLVTIGVYSIWNLSYWWLCPVLLGAFLFWNLLYVFGIWIICEMVDMEKEYDDIDPFYHKQMMIFLNWARNFSFKLSK